jgi:hypothetical protein
MTNLKLNISIDLINLSNKEAFNIQNGLFKKDPIIFQDLENIFVLSKRNYLCINMNQNEFSLLHEIRNVEINIIG